MSLNQALSSDLSFSLVEVMRLLGLQTETVVDRKQMAQLLAVAADPMAEGGSSRAPRYSLVVIAGARAAIELLKAQTGYQAGKLKMNATALRKATQRLWDLGVSFPLSQGVLAWDSALRRYVFLFDGFLIDAKNGQAQIEALHEMIADRADTQEVLDAARITVARRQPPTTPLVLTEVSTVVVARSATVLL